MTSLAAYLTARGVSEEEAARAGIHEVPSAKALCSAMRPLQSMVLPYFEADGTQLDFFRLRYLEEGPQHGFTQRKAPRYVQPPHSGCHAYLPPVVDWAAILADSEEPIIITEGEIKALASSLRVGPTIGLGGVFNFSEAGVGGLLPELEGAVWEGRDTYLCFDSDADTNPNVAAAEGRLVDALQTQRGARCKIVRLPAESGTKVGLDDYLVLRGPAAMVQQLQGARDLYALDAKVIGLNRTLAWIEREGMAYDTDARLFISKDNLVNGSRYSAIRHIQPAKKGSEPKVIQVSRVWLQHPHAQRYSEILFRPGEAAVVRGDNGGLAMNMWTDWEEEEGDVAPFMELSEHLFEGMRQHSELPLKLMAYKAQHPQEKIPLALMLIGTQGSGKSLWGECVREAFGRWGAAITSKSLLSEFQGWMENSLFAFVNEAEATHLTAGKDHIKSLVSDLRQPMNEKYRPAREINSYTMYCFTANSRAVGSFDFDDRRFVVVNCPGKREKEFYDRVSKWKEAGGPKKLMHWLLTVDLGDWRPPQAAPMTAEKYLAYVEGLTPFQRIAEDMRTADEHTIKQWLDAALAWAEQAELSNQPYLVQQAHAIRDAAPHWQLRPWYTPEELHHIFPMLLEQQSGSRMKSVGPGGLSRQLRDAGIPYLECLDDARGFMWQGKLHQYLVIADFAEWAQPLKQSEFDRYMKHWPRYGAVAKARRVGA